ncbi:MAG: YfiR family protein [Candidatus Sulfotelmatobacter sp.]
MAPTFQTLAVVGRLLPDLKRRPGKFPAWPRRLKFVLLLLFLFVFLLPCLQAQEARPTDVEVQAAYLFNFGKFVRWPLSEDAQSNLLPLNICVLGKSSFGSVLDSTVRGETIDGRPVVAKTIPSLQDAASCRIVFISASEEGRLGAILPALRHQGILTVSNIPHFTDRGGMIEFVNFDDRIRFAVNLVPLREAGLSVSSELLKVAIRVIGQMGRQR